MVQQQVIRETVTEEGITKKAQEIKQVFLSVYEKPCSYFINDSLSQVHQAGSAWEQVAHLPQPITAPGWGREGAQHSALMALLLKVYNGLN